MYQLDAPEALIALDETASSVGSGLKTIRISPDGMVKSRNGSFVLDAEDAGRIIAEFAGHKTDLVIDFEHQTLGGAYAAPDGRAPAAGWVTKLFHEPGRGLFGLVKWNAEAVDLIRRDSYRYLSPVFSVDRKSKHAVALHSAGLTNKPAIPGMDKLAASERAVLANADGGAAMDLGRQLASAMLDRGVSIALDADVETVLRAALTFVQSTAGGPADPDTQANAELTRLTGDRDRLAQENFDLRLAAMMEPYERAGKLPVGFIALREAVADTAKAKGLPAAQAILDTLPTVIPQGRLTPLDPSTPAVMSRTQVIANAAREYRDNRILQGVTSLQAFVNMKLGEAATGPASAEELKTLAG